MTLKNSDIHAGAMTDWPSAFYACAAHLQTPYAYGCGLCLSDRSLCRKYACLRFKGPRGPIELRHRYFMVTADKWFLHDHILFPNQTLPAGYPPIMPSFAGQISEENLAALADSIKPMQPQRGTP